MEQSYAGIIASLATSHLPNASHSNHNDPSSSLTGSGAWFGGTATATASATAQTSCAIARQTLDNCKGTSYHLMVLRYCSAILARIVDAYLSSTICLALVPLFCGLCVGYVLGAKRRRQTSTIEEDEDDDDAQNCTTFGDFKDLWLISLSLTLACWYQKARSILTPESLALEERNIDMKKEKPPISLTRKTDSSVELDDERERYEHAKTYLNSAVNTERESGIELSKVPKHIAVIMDGNRRYGRNKYGSATRGHWDGSKTLVDFAKWCLAEGVEVVTVYAFSTENWNRSASEVSALMAIFCKYCDELRSEALDRGIKLNVLSTETEQIPDDVKAGISKMVNDTKHCKNLTMNICLSYGSRGEIVNACKSIAADVNDGSMNVSDISENSFASRLLTHEVSDPDVIIRTSGEFRLSNFLLWQLAYSEMFFLDKQWPELTKADLLHVIKNYAKGRTRRFGK